VTYKITTQVTIEIFPYQDADEEIPDYDCHESLAAMKENLFLILNNVQDKIQSLTLKEIKKGVRL
jgi:hypothetical protein